MRKIYEIIQNSSYPTGKQKYSPRITLYYYYYIGILKEVITNPFSFDPLHKYQFHAEISRMNDMQLDTQGNSKHSFRSAKITYVLKCVLYKPFTLEEESRRIVLGLVINFTDNRAVLVRYCNSQSNGMRHIRLLDYK